MKQNVTAPVVKQLMYRGKIFQVDEYVRVLLKRSHNPKSVCEYIAFIKDITENTVILFSSNWSEVKRIDVSSIDKIRVAKNHENFYDNFDWDEEIEEKEYEEN